MLLYNIEVLAKKLATEYATTTEKLEHMGLRGTAREDLLKEVISQLIPEKYRIGSGTIVDIHGTQSKQQDLYIYDAFNSPVFLKMESNNVVPVESVYATVEVKSTLTKDTLRQSMENIRTVKTLEHNELRNSPIVFSRHNMIMGCIFSYTSSMEFFIMQFCSRMSRTSSWSTHFFRRFSYSLCDKSRMILHSF